MEGTTDINATPETERANEELTNDLANLAPEEPTPAATPDAEQPSGKVGVPAAAPTAGAPDAPADAPDAQPPSQPTAEQPTAQQPDFSSEQALFDRAIRAGLSSKDVLSIQSRDMVERMVEMAEKANGISPKQDQPNGVAGTPDADSVESVIEAMQKDGGYDANLMKLLGGLVAENKKLRSAGKSAEKESFIDKQIGSLDEGIRSRVDKMHKSQLQAKFDLLKAGYRAQGSHILDEDIFREAARLAIGDLIGQAREERKASALEQRRNLALARPGGESGRRGGATAEDDPFADFVAAMG